MSSVTAPGLTAFPPSSSAWAAIRPATRIASMISGGWTSGSVFRAGAGLSTYSGRAIDDGTNRRGLCTPGVNGARTGMPSTLRGTISAERLEEAGGGLDGLGRRAGVGDQDGEGEVAPIAGEPAVRVGDRKSVV